MKLTIQNPKARYWNGNIWKSFTLWQRLKSIFGYYPKDWKVKTLDEFKGFWIRIKVND